MHSLTNKERYREWPKGADKSAVGAINRPLRLSGFMRSQKGIVDCLTIVMAKK